MYWDYKLYINGPFKCKTLLCGLNKLVVVMENNVNKSKKNK